MSDGVGVGVGFGDGVGVGADFGVGVGVGSKNRFQTKIEFRRKIFQMEIGNMIKMKPPLKFFSNNLIYLLWKSTDESKSNSE